jgi:hypothetical protein
MIWGILGAEPSWQVSSYSVPRRVTHMASCGTRYAAVLGADATHFSLALDASAWCLPT